MPRKKIKIAVVAPASTVKPETAERAQALAASLYGEAVEIDFHPQCFLREGHFAGSDAERSAAFLEAANDPDADAVWFGRGGYGACRLDEAVFGELNEAARAKTYLGYSDLGTLLARLDREKIGRPVHGPMPSDIAREGGEAAVARALKFLVEDDAGGLEPSLKAGETALAFNIMTLSSLIGGPYEPDFSGRVLMLEEVNEYLYRVDRALFHITSSPNMRRCAGVRLGRVSDVPDNDPPFEKTAQEVIEYWCARSGVPYLGPADIGHDAANKLAPFSDWRGTSAKATA